MKLKMGVKFREAVDFLIDLLSGTEMPVSEVLCLAKEKRITKVTLRRAREYVGVKCRRKGFGGEGTMFWSISEGLQGHDPGDFKTVVSSDFVSVVLEDDSCTNHGADRSAKAIPCPGVRIKVGVYEVEVAEDISPDKLKGLLRVLSGTPVEASAADEQRTNSITENAYMGGDCK